MKILCLIVLLAVPFYACALFKNIPEQLQNEVFLLNRFPETEQLMHLLEKGGDIELKWCRFGNKHFQAFWAGPIRTIGLNSEKMWGNGEKLYSLLFELHNALTDKKLKELDALAEREAISKSEYVRCVETIEYQNVVKTTELIKKGIGMGYFPIHYKIPVYLTLEAHLAMQLQSGHSESIAKKYGDLSRN